MSEHEAFASRPDPRLGGLLRSYLDREGRHEEFAARVLARLGEPASSWEVLAGWARPGVAAAVLAAALAGYWFVIREERPSAPELVAELAATDHPIDRDVLLGDALGTGR
jgi:anti-sigma-K factor RskA